MLGAAAGIIYTQNLIMYLSLFSIYIYRRANGIYIYTQQFAIAAYGQFVLVYLEVDMRRQYVSGFTGSAGSALITSSQVITFFNLILFQVMIWKVGGGRAGVSHIPFSIS